MRLQDSSRVISAGQDNTKQPLLLDESTRICSRGLSHMEQHVASSFSTSSTTQQSSFSGLSNTHHSENTGDCHRRKTLRSYGRQTIIRYTQDTISTSNQLNENHEKCDFQPVNVRDLTASWSAKSDTTWSSSSDCDILNEILPVIAVIPATPRGSIGSPLPQDSPITVQKFAKARSKVLLKRRSSFLSSAPPLMAAPCLACSRPERLLSEDDLSCRKCRKQWLVCQLWYQACDGGRMERLRVPFVRPGESNAANRALLESLGLLPSSASKKDSRERVAKPNRILGLCFRVLVKPVWSLVGRKVQSLKGLTEGALDACGFS